MVSTFGNSIVALIFLAVLSEFGVAGEIRGLSLGGRCYGIVQGR
jgi:hypothetical protein